MLRRVLGQGIFSPWPEEANRKLTSAITNYHFACEALKGITKTFAITDGANGAMVFDGDDITPVAAVPTKAIDTNGAGDMFAGAVLYGITSGRDYIWSARLGNESAARVVAKFGPRLNPAEFELIEQDIGF